MAQEAPHGKAFTAYYNKSTVAFMSLEKNPYLEVVNDLEPTVIEAKDRKDLEEIQKVDDSEPCSHIQVQFRKGDNDDCVSISASITTTDKLISSVWTRTRHAYQWCPHSRCKPLAAAITVAGLTGVALLAGIIAWGVTRTSHQQDIDMCSSSPCGYSHTCINGLDSFTCHCADNFTGIYCTTAPGQPTRPTIYFTSGTDQAAHITKVTPDLLQTHQQSSGTWHCALAVDNKTSQIYYTTCDVWRANLSDIKSTQTLVASSYGACGGCPIYGLGLSTGDQLIFTDFNSGCLVMFSYGGKVLHALTLDKGSSIGLAVDENSRTLYLVDSFRHNTIWAVFYTQTGFTGSPSLVLSGNGEGQAGSGLSGIVYEDGALYWLVASGEIRSMSVTGNTSTTVVKDIGTSLYLAKRGATFYYTSTYISSAYAGIYEVTAGGTALRLVHTPVQPWSILVV